MSTGAMMASSSVCRLGRLRRCLRSMESSISMQWSSAIPTAPRMPARVFTHYREAPEMRLRDSLGRYVISIGSAVGILPGHHYGDRSMVHKGSCHCGKVRYEVDG